MPHALIVEDDPNSLSGLSAILTADDFTVDTATTLAEARAALSRSIPDVVLIDLNLPDGSGLDLLPSLPSHAPDGALPVIVMTGNATVESAIEGLRHGIWDYLLKPVNIPRLRSLLARIPRPYELTEEVQALRSTLRELGHFGEMLGRSAAMQHVYDLIEHTAPTEAAVLICGEAGTGKKIAARTIHELSRRRKGPFVTFDCSAARDGAHRSMESVLFGHERNAFAGAENREPGLLEQSGGGTLFLDQIDSLPAAQQEALLRALDSQTFMRVGGSNRIMTDFRLIAASRTPIRDAVANGALREDLFQRLAGSSINLPPLRERDDDIALVAEQFVDELNRENHIAGITSGSPKRISPAFLRECIANEWPGNVRELRERVRRAYHASGETIETLRADEQGGSGRGLNGSSVQVTVGTALADVEDMLIRATLEAVGGTRHRAATLLGISPKTLYNKLQRMKLESS
ncbi:sigma-54 dependent transcriptional regulator [Caballeronia sp. LP006]|uniref:sigma-54-dependent transcriptional regulator n=1 Tax=unclassified Caballeronia TaxID=2646786 RepID=UPI001FD50CFD|nr:MULTISPECIES: sigma-54 dependent transcriptional regulator [unclassified Caballeronia]MDR5772161.1 sigma-54 dependent transcriptional regulator [Caballeronia sp. LZ002]MDR5804405.1 sigma-54 dependent transcriptional regulator [Caballeronia sp. LZ001]MDR5831748.1 sigma-54 dependent transcriptional regulator [Caballeronia sp. LP006]MDR5847595.1 sigma-54 dependent transcriptional regulator [Caballeronia sp. LZ003]